MMRGAEPPALDDFSIKTLIPPAHVATPLIVTNNQGSELILKKEQNKSTLDKSPKSKEKSISQTLEKIKIKEYVIDNQYLKK